MMMTTSPRRCEPQSDEPVRPALPAPRAPSRLWGRRRWLAVLAVLLVWPGGLATPGSAAGQAQEPAPLPRAELEAATEAAQAVLNAWAAPDLARVRQRATPVLAEELGGMRHAEAVQATTVHELGEARVTVRLDQHELEFQFAWQAELDVDAFVDAAMTRLARRAEREGETARFEQEAERLRAELRQWGTLQAERVGFSPQRLRMRRTGDGWRLAGWLTVQTGASEPDVAAELFLAALAARDTVQARGAMSPPLRAAFEDRIGRHLLLGSDVLHYEQTRLEHDPQQPAQATAYVRWQVDFRPEWVAAHLVEEYRWELEFGEEELSAEQREARLRTFREQVERRTNGFAERVGALGATVTLVRRAGQWSVADVQPREEEAPGGADSPEEALREALAALQQHDFEALDRLYDPTRREGFARGENGRRVARALTLEEFELGELEQGRRDGQAWLRFRWQARFDADRYAEALRDQFREHARERGQSRDEIEATLNEHAEQLREHVHALRDELEQAEQAAELRRVGERWFVVELVVPR